MASSIALHSLPLRRPSASAAGCRPLPPLILRRRSLSLLLISSPAISILPSNSPSRAEDIPLFGLRKKLKKVEEEAEEIVREGEEIVREGEEVVEKEIAVVEQGIQAAEEGLAASAAGGVGLGFGDLVQAGAVAGAEAVGVLVAMSVVKGILGPEGKKP